VTSYRLLTLEVVRSGATDLTSTHEHGLLKQPVHTVNPTSMDFQYATIRALYVDIWRNVPLICGFFGVTSPWVRIAGRSCMDLRITVFRVRIYGFSYNAQDHSRKFLGTPAPTTLPSEVCCNIDS
jgi:hypothetical protein